MERNVLGRIVACGPALENARVLLRGLNYPGGLAVAADGHLWFTESFGHRVSRALISGRRRHRSAADRDPQHARISGASRPQRRRRLLAQSLCRAHALDRVRAARGRFPRGDDADNSAGLLDRARARRPAAIVSSRCRSARIKALGIEKPWAPPRSYGLLARHRRRRRSGGKPAQPRRRPLSRHHRRHAKRRRASSSYPKAAAGCCCDNADAHR